MRSLGEDVLPMEAVGLSPVRVRLGTGQEASTERATSCGQEWRAIKWLLACGLRLLYIKDHKSMLEDAYFLRLWASPTLASSLGYTTAALSANICRLGPTSLANCSLCHAQHRGVLVNALGPKVILKQPWQVIQADQATLRLLQGWKHSSTCLPLLHSDLRLACACCWSSDRLSSMHLRACRSHLQLPCELRLKPLKSRQLPELSTLFARMAEESGGYVRAESEASPVAPEADGSSDAASAVRTFCPFRFVFWGS